jgi:hypothetical protein
LVIDGNIISASLEAEADDLLSTRVNGNPTNAIISSCNTGNPATFDIASSLKSFTNVFEFTVTNQQGNVGFGLNTSLF